MPSLRTIFTFILVEKKCAGSINGHRARSFPGADNIGSDHNLVLMAIKMQLEKLKKRPTTRLKYNTERLNVPHDTTSISGKNWR